jgi:hypothetical protein
VLLGHRPQACRAVPKVVEVLGVWVVHVHGCTVSL